MVLKNAIIFSIGNELVEGLILDTNSKYLSEKLKKLGYYVIRIETLPDRFDVLVERFKTGLLEVDLLITTGGLGPTEDDLTREALAEALGRKLILDENIAQELIERALKYYGKAPESVKKQAMVIEGAKVLDNPVGTAPGQMIEFDGKAVVILPGPPAEMIPIFENITEKLKADDALYTRRIKTIGIPEAVLMDDFKDVIYSNPNITVATMASYERGVEVRLTGSKSLKEEIDKIALKLIEALGENVYATDDDNIEDVVYKLLSENGLTISFAESCTGGMISSKFVDIPGVSKVYNGSVVAYSNEVKISLLNVPETIISTYGAVSEECVKFMAENVRRILKSDFAVAVSGIAGPTGGSEAKPVGTVCFAFSSDSFTHTVTHNLRGNREMVRKRSTLLAFDIARRGILRWLRQRETSKE
ncbi:nicotinamide-nucleotide amidase [Fervidobacterium changbaicum]|uniref:CinA-like protein n=1 Tax=Fervidobacterium islandicum TaxID=2423 RepID=A0AAI8CP93_FERIS|nr:MULTISPECIES: competence/damage-inducible protein A [Fervidobacterium]AMW33795.2 competence/damage-inducible protein A [Fervidobacterium islandicum]SDG91738.1 nicotinamide-nucleotide amidase [Fervidobacterium changbaicum]